MSRVQPRHRGEVQATGDEIKARVARDIAEGRQADVMEVTYKEPTLSVGASQLRQAVEQARALYEYFCEQAREMGVAVEDERAREWICREYPSLAPYFEDTAYRNNMVLATSAEYTDVYYSFHMRKLDVQAIFDRGEITKRELLARLGVLDQELRTELERRARAGEATPGLKLARKARKGAK